MTRLAPALVALAVGLAAGAGGAALALRGGGSGPEVARHAPARLGALPPGPVEVAIETVRLGAGFTSHHRHGGLTVNLVRSGEVEIDDPTTGVRRYRAGDTFVEPPGRVHTIRILAATRIDVVRVLPAGARATTEVAPGSRGG